MNLLLKNHYVSVFKKIIISCLLALVLDKHCYAQKFNAKSTTGNPTGVPDVKVIYWDATSAPSVTVLYHVTKGSITSSNLSIEGENTQQLGGHGLGTNFSASFNISNVNFGNAGRSNLILTYKYSEGGVEKSKTLKTGIARSDDKPVSSVRNVMNIQPPSGSDKGGKPIITTFKVILGEHTLRGVSYDFIVDAPVKTTSKNVSPISCYIEYSCSRLQMPNTVGIGHEHLIPGSSPVTYPTRLKHADGLMSTDGPDVYYASEGKDMIDIINGKLVPKLYLSPTAQGHSTLYIFFTDATDSVIPTLTSGAQNWVKLD